jgi:hypothetical protein
MKINSIKYATAIGFAILAIILITGCTQTSAEQPITNLTFPGHSIMYTFNNDIRESILLDVPQYSGIRSLFYRESTINIVFNGTNEQDNGMFQVPLIDFTAKVPFYLAAEGKNETLRLFYYVDEGNVTQWYDFENNQIDKPDFDGTVIWLRGPMDGANSTSIRLENNTIFVQAQNNRNMSVAFDKLTLIVMGIDNIEQVPEYNQTK